MTAEDIATVLAAIGDSWPAAIVVVFLAIAFVVWKAVELLKGIKYQVNNNGGGSMKDSVDRIEETLTQHLAESAEDRRRLAALEGRDLPPAS